MPAIEPFVPRRQDERPAARRALALRPRRRDHVVLMIVVDRAAHWLPLVLRADLEDRVGPGQAAEAGGEQQRAERVLERRGRCRGSRRRAARCRASSNVSASSSARTSGCADQADPAVVGGERAHARVGRARRTGTRCRRGPVGGASNQRARKRAVVGRLAQVAAAARAAARRRTAACATCAAWRCATPTSGRRPPRGLALEVDADRAPVAHDVVEQEARRLARRVRTRTGSGRGSARSRERAHVAVQLARLQQQQHPAREVRVGVGVEADPRREVRHADRLAEHALGARAAFARRRARPGAATTSRSTSAS